MIRFYIITSALILMTPLGGFSQEILKDSITTSKVLNEAQVIAYKKINKGDTNKQIFELDDKGIPFGASLSRALRFIPGITGSESGYNIIGSNRKAKILIDGVEANVQEIDALPAKDIWRIEVIQGGIDGDRINIRRRRTITNEFKGRLGIGAKTTPGYSTNGSLTWQNPKVNLTFTPTYLWNRQKSYSQTERRRLGEDIWIHNSNTDIWQASGILRLNYFPNKNWDNTLVAMYSGIGDKGTTLSIHNGQVPIPLLYKGGENVLEGHLASKYSWGSSYLRLRAYIDYEQERKDLEISSTINQAGNRYFSLTGDLTYQTRLRGMYGDHTLQYYYGLENRRTQGEYYPISQKSLIQTLQINDVVNWGDAWSAEASLTLQHDTQKYNSITRSSFHLLPYASFRYSGDRDGFTLSYLQSVYRPTGSILDPTRYYTSDTEYTEGNPNVGNHRSHDISLSYQRQIRSSYLSIGISYLANRDVIGRVYSATDPNLRTWGNIGKSSEVYLSLGLYSSLFQRKLNMNMSGSIGYADHHLSPNPDRISMELGGRGINYRGRINLSYKTSKDWNYTVYVTWSGRKLDFSSVQRLAPYVYFELDKDIIREKLSLSLTVLNPWGKGRHRMDYLFKDIDQKKWFVNNGTSNISLNLTYTFGKKFRTREGNSIIEHYDRKKGNE